MTLGIVASLLGALTLTLALTPLMRRLALKLDIVDSPDRRKKHLLTTPLLGGLSIYISFSIVLVAGMLLWTPESTRMVALEWKPLCLLLLAGGGLMAVTGLVDDMLGLKPLMKLVLHTISALVVGYIFVMKGTLLNLFMTGSSAAWLAAPLTILWLVGMTNSLNLLDHADGLATGVSMIAAIFFAVINYLFGSYQIAFISAALAGAAGGFLFFNSTPASIFMGDCGSNMLGFILGVIAIMGVYTPAGSIREISVLAPLLVLSVPLIDTVFVLLYRRKAGKPLFDADRNHLAHRLMRIGLSHSEAVKVLYIVATLMGILALLLPTLAPYQAVLLLCHAIILVALFSFFIKRAEKNRSDSV